MLGFFPLIGFFFVVDFTVPLLFFFLPSRPTKVPEALMGIDIFPYTFYGLGLPICKHLPYFLVIL